MPISIDQRRTLPLDEIVIKIYEAAYIALSNNILGSVCTNFFIRPIYPKVIIKEMFSDGILFKKRKSVIKK